MNYRNPTVPLDLFEILRRFSEFPNMILRFQLENAVVFRFPASVDFLLELFMSSLTIFDSFFLSLPKP